MPVQKTQEEFIKDAQKIHGTRYSYEKTVYSNMHTKVTITCKDHGDFTIKPCSHIHNQQGCAICAGNNKLTTEEFIKKASEVHSNFYNYDKTNYVSSHKSVTITCPLHGDFQQQAYVHLQKHGCPKCGKETTSRKNKENPDIWTYRGWENAGKYSKEFIGYTLYIIELWDNNERFLKIGKSFTELKRRFRGAFSYEWCLITSYTGSANFISTLEKELHSLYKNYKYTPNQKFNGSAECFTIDLKEKLDELNQRAAGDFKPCNTN